MKPKLAFGAFVVLTVLAIAWIQLAVFPKASPIVITGAPPAEFVTVQAQLQMQQRHQEQLVALVSASMQVVIVVALGLAAFSWWTTNRQYERDAQVLRDHAAALVTAAEERITTEISKQSVTGKQEAVAVATKAAQDAAQAAVKSVKESLKDLRDTFWWEQYRYHDARADAATTEYNRVTALLDAFEALTKWPWAQAGGSYAGIIEKLEDVIRKGKYRLDGHESAKLEELLLKVLKGDVTLQPAVERLRQAVKEKP